MKLDVLRCLALVVGLSACSDTNKPPATSSEIDSGCQSYCAKANSCNKSIAVDRCVRRCKNRLGRCMADEQADTVDDLKACATDKCGEFAVCAVGAGLQCTFGL